MTLLETIRAEIAPDIFSDDPNVVNRRLMLNTIPNSSSLEWLRDEADRKARTIRDLVLEEAAKVIDAKAKEAADEMVERSITRSIDSYADGRVAGKLTMAEEGAAAIRALKGGE